jgi:hypothetical protein
MSSSRFYSEIAGWYGVIAILVAYAGNMLGWIGVDSMLYLFLNITGSLGILVDAAKQKNWQPVVLNAVWMVIAIIGLIR